jgi:adenosylcobalamin-dependent ribonucleoside-triphosphate reductase
MEVFTNCATSASNFVLFQLLLNGAGVGRCYDDDMMLVNWDNAPAVLCVLSEDHADFDWSAHESYRDALHKYWGNSDTLWHTVTDDREGWAKALEIYENAAFEKVHRDKLLILDFSQVRCKGSAIKGMQGRPASGPVPLMNAFAKANTIKSAGMARWKQAMYIDHYFAECVLVGGARRAARMSTKTWRDKTVLDFIKIKRPIEYQGLDMEQIARRRKSTAERGTTDMPFLWSSNNSVTVDEEFWEQAKETGTHAHNVLETLLTCAYADGTGEPGVINVDKLVQKDDGWESLASGDYVGSKKYQVEDDTLLYLSRLAKRAVKKPQHTITNPCGEIALNILGGFCVLADNVPYHADSLQDAQEGLRASTRALIRVNLMDSVYGAEVRRTNRIGVGLTGVHEFAWKFFRVGFRDMINPDWGGYRRKYQLGDQHGLQVEERIGQKEEDPRLRACAFWSTISAFSEAVCDEAIEYASHLGMERPHTIVTIKPAGTTSKLFGLTEGWHLPAMRQYIRWVQFEDKDPLIDVYRAKGYPVRVLTQYRGHTIVGFPTEPTIATLGMGDKLVTAGEATPEEQYRWLMLGEKHWLNQGYSQDHGWGNQISYTLKYDPAIVSYEEFKRTMVEYQAQIRACSVMPAADTSAFEYLPEQTVSKAEYEAVCHAISNDHVTEDVGLEHVDCENGACPVSFKADKGEEYERVELH